MENQDFALDVTKVVVGAVVEASKDSPEMKQAGKNLGSALVTVTELLNTVLLPIAMANFGAKKFQNYIETRFPVELEDKLRILKSEQLTLPNMSVAGPALDALVYAHEDDELRKMYVGLIASSMDSESAKIVHPAFTEILKQISPEEITNLRMILLGDQSQSICRLDIQIEDTQSYSTIANYVLDFGAEINIKLNSQEFEYQIENWIRLGLISVDFTRMASGEGVYDWTYEHPLVLEAQREFSQKLHMKQGLLQVTRWGRNFAKTVGMPELG